MADEDDSVLMLVGIGLPPYSARGLTQTLEPIGQASNPRRSINGALKDTSGSQFRKYRSVISATDQEPPAFDGVWAGALVTVDCVAELALDEYAAFGRGIVPGSQRHNGAYQVYRPVLNMMVVNFSISQDEWGRAISWTLELEEV